MRPFPVLRGTFSLLAFAGLMLSLDAFAAAAGKLPSPVTLLRLEAGVQRDGLLRFHTATVDRQSLAEAAVPGGLLVLPSPDGGQLSYDYVSHTEHASGDLTWVGRAEGAALGQEAVVTIGADAVFGRLPRPDGSVLQIETVGGRTRLMVDEAATQGQSSELQVEDARTPPLALLQAASPPRTAGALTPDAPQGNPNQLDVMLAYNGELATYVGSDAAVRTLLQNRIDVGNTALANGGVVGRFRLVATPRVDFTNAGSNSDALDQITYWRRDTAPAIAFQLATLRHRHGADIVGLIRRFDKDVSVSCGNGWVGGYMGSNMSGSVDYGYFTASHGTSGGSFCSDRTIGHEIGHNLGQNHDIVTSSTRNGAHTYSHGYRVTPAGNDGFYTVMAYRDGSQKPALTFSNPTITRADCSNQACGLVDADTVRSLNITLPGAAAWFRPADEAVRDIAGTRGHFEVTLSGLPALTNARWRIEYVGSGRLFATGPTVAAAGAAVTAKVSWDALPGNPATPLAVRLVVESSPGVVAGSRDLQVYRRDWLPAARALANGVATTVAVPAWNRTVEESRLYFPVPPHARSVRIQVSSAVDVDVYAGVVTDASASYPQIGAGNARTVPSMFDNGPGLTKTIDVATPADGTPSRVLVTLARPNTGSLNYQAATVTARVQTQVPAPAFQSGQYFNPDRSGHGVFVDFAGGQWVAVWYTYLEDGSPTWYYSEGPAPEPSGTGLWSAPLFRIGWNGSAISGTEVGQMLVTPTSASTMVFSYNLDGDSGTEKMIRLGGGTGCPTSQGAPLDATGHWFSPSLSGFGYSAQFEPDQEIYAAYLYDAAGVARWLIGAKPWDESISQVNLEQLTGSCPTCGFATYTSRPTGTLTRTLGTSSDGKRGLTQISVTAPLLAPLGGSWSQARATALLSARKDCR